MPRSSVVRPWLLLIHQIPPKPDYFRVKVGRRLQRIGAVPIKNSVYVLPDTEGALEDFETLQREIVKDGGAASICRSVFIAGLSNAELNRRFRETYGRSPRAAVGVSEGLAAEPTARGRTWVTREGIFVDRIASAW